MNVQVYSFLETEGVSDQTILFYWFMSRILSMGGLEENYTISNYDLKVLLRGHSMGEFTANSVPSYVSRYFDIGFVTRARQSIKLNKKTLEERKVSNGKKLGKLIDVKITDQKVIAMHLYLLGVLAGSDSMFYEAKYFGLGDKTDREYHEKSKVLTRHEIAELLNGAQVDTGKL